MDVEIVRRVCLARHLYELAKDHSGSDNELYLFSTANLLQDAVEAFLLAIGDHLDANFDIRTTFDQYFVKINERIAPNKLPFKSKLLRLNRIRVDSKHHGIKPAKGELDRLVVVANEFFEESCRAVLGVNFFTLSTIDLLNEGDSKQFLVEAKNQFENGDLAECSIACRKAIYMEIEKHYNIFNFKEGSPPPSGLLGLFGIYTNAPVYARNNDYIVQNVKIPTDYIVHDVAHLDHELVKYGIDNTAFWNLIRLTPPVFKDRDGDWFVRWDFALLDNDFLAGKIQYILDTTINVIFSIHNTKNTVKTQSYQQFHMDLLNFDTPVYQKASRTSNVVGYTPKGLKQIDCRYRIEGFEGEGPYWNVWHWEGTVNISGFIHNDDLIARIDSEVELTGSIKWYSSDKGYGFIQGNDGNEYFCHHSDFATQEESQLVKGILVGFLGRKEEKGLAAKEIKFLRSDDA